LRKSLSSNDLIQIAIAAAEGFCFNTKVLEHGHIEVAERLGRFAPVSLPEDKIKEIMRIMKSYAGSKGVDVLPQVDGWVG
jgi:hypothetical protein